MFACVLKTQTKQQKLWTLQALTLELMDLKNEDCASDLRKVQNQLKSGARDCLKVKNADFKEHNTA